MTPAPSDICATGPRLGTESADLLMCPTLAQGWSEVRDEEGEWLGQVDECGPSLWMVALAALSWVAFVWLVVSVVIGLRTVLDWMA